MVFCGGVGGHRRRACLLLVRLLEEDKAMTGSGRGRSYDVRCVSAVVLLLSATNQVWFRSQRGGSGTGPKNPDVSVPQKPSVPETPLHPRATCAATDTCSFVALLPGAQQTEGFFCATGRVGGRAPGCAAVPGSSQVGAFAGAVSASALLKS